ncbi:prolyl oligopeptidase family serine peptidase [Ekhidna sp.]|jgi:dipeptidyl aminopeptidase/acylaminoacyl peptidase|uniref:S9 family peptidase n=1 Tax=Ekhidna sp. TaxID=2608089 RepID=UPI0032EF427D
MKKIMNSLFLTLFSLGLFAQGGLEYQEPPKEIKELIDAPLAPWVRIDNKGENVVLLYRNAYKSIAELSEEELRLGGLRINPVTNIGSRTTFYNNVKVKKAFDENAKQVTGLPENPRLAYFSWSPDEKMMAFTHTTATGVEIWVLNVEKGSAKKLTNAGANANLGWPMVWAVDGKSLLVKMLPEDREPLINTETAVPTGPTVSVSSGEKAQNRTYQDLLKNPVDEKNFEQLARSEIFKVTLDGNTSKWMDVGMYRGMDFSPDGNYVLITKVKRPFSYLVPYYRFASETAIYDKNGKQVKLLLDMPVDEVRPKGFMATTDKPRSFRWRADKPASMVWAQALDGGDPAKEMEFRDEVYELPAPFAGDERSLLKTKNRFSGITWGTDDTAIAYDYWFDNRNTKTYVFNPSDNSKEAKILFDRNYQDAYSDPGNFVTTKNKLNQYVLSMDGSNAYLMGDGFTDEGQFPFVDQMNLESGNTTRLYQSEYTDKVEDLVDAIDMSKGEILVRIESPTEYPNYYVRNIKKKMALKPITQFENPFKAMMEVEKEVITYEREDGIELTGTLYLPVGYDKEKKEKMPMIMWAYPVEYKDKASAGQNTTNPNEFIYPWYGSPVFWVTRGYVVLDDAAFPIIGEGDEQPNDTFRKQLVANAKAGIDAVDAMGYIDRDRVAVGGHSYGAFMVANLLSHSDLFAAGIARSGAYNRTLTPFGFQREERSYWEAPEVYYTMSPFMHADKMKTPLLLIHGEADNNSGTYPMQSERYFNALKGLGGPARLVMLPKESHGYRAKESILHVLWEQDAWLEEHVKNKDPMETTVEMEVDKE